MQLDDALAGNTAADKNSSRAGFMPVPLSRVPAAALQTIPVYLRSSSNEAKPFVLYRSQGIRFTQADRDRLLSSDVQFVYIPISEHHRYRIQIEAGLADLANDPTVAKAEAAALVYETSLELVNELLSEPNLSRQLPRLEKVARAVTTLTIKEHDAFEQLFLTAHHDFYTATHTVNVATWMVSLAYAMGYDDDELLNVICQAGMLHDIGKIYLPAELLNKTHALSDRDWQVLRQHPSLGRKHLEQHDGVDPVILRVTEEHHERLDGTGYPHGLTEDKIHPISKICAVVDSFDAMTAFRPYKAKTLTVHEALKCIGEETPARYDPVALDAWRGLMESVGDVPLLGEPPACAADPATPNGFAVARAASARRRPDEALAAVVAQSPSTVGSVARSPKTVGSATRRKFQRFNFHCPARVYEVEVGESGYRVGRDVEATAHNISRSGLALLSKVPIDVGHHVRVYLSTRGLKRECLEGIVARCHAYTDGHFDVGIALGKIE